MSINSISLASFIIRGMMYATCFIIYPTLSKASVSSRFEEDSTSTSSISSSLSDEFSDDDCDKVISLLTVEDSTFRQASSQPRPAYRYTVASPAAIPVALDENWEIDIPYRRRIEEYAQKLAPQQMNAIETFFSQEAVRRHLRLATLKAHDYAFSTPLGVCETYFKTLVDLGDDLEPVCDILNSLKLNIIYDYADDIIDVIQHIRQYTRSVDVILPFITHHAIAPHIRTTDDLYLLLPAICHATGNTDEIGVFLVTRLVKHLLKTQLRSQRC